MPGKNESVKQLIRELQAGKRKLLLEYKKGVRVLDEAIAALQKVDMTVKTNATVTVKSGKRGRSANTDAKPQLTQLIVEAVKQRKKLLAQREIVQIVAKKFPDEEPADFSKKVSVLLASLKRQRRLVSIKAGDANKSMLWGLPEFTKKNRSKGEI